MGYYSTCHGEVFFDPPISDELVKTIQDELPDLEFHAAVSNEGLGDGKDSGKAYHLEEDSRELLDYLAREGSRATGWIIVEGEENTDVWRLIFKDGTITRENVKLIWPDGSEYTG